MNSRSFDFGSIIKSYRAKGNMSQSELAKLLKISSQLLYKYENNLSFPSIARFFEICNILKINVKSVFEVICSENVVKNPKKDVEFDGSMFSSFNFSKQKFIKDPKISFLLKKLRKKLSHMKSVKNQKILLEINDKLMNKSLAELRIINKMLK